jgi:hypothetical protein
MQEICRFARGNGGASRGHGWYQAAQCSSVERAAVSGYYNR